jgi:hypothetical protein
MMMKETKKRGTHGSMIFPPLSKYSGLQVSQ